MDHEYDLTAVITFTDRLGMLVGRDGHVVDHDEFAEVVREAAADRIADLAVTTWSQVVGTMPTPMLVEVVRRCAEAGLPDEERDNVMTQTNSLVDAARRVRRGEGTRQPLAVVDDLRRNQQMGRALTFRARVAGAVIPTLGGLGTAIRLRGLVPVDPALHPDGVAVVLAAVGSAAWGSNARPHPRHPAEHAGSATAGPGGPAGAAADGHDPAAHGYRRTPCRGRSGPPRPTDRSGRERPGAGPAGAAGPGRSCRR